MSIHLRHPVLLALGPLLWLTGPAASGLSAQAPRPGVMPNPASPAAFSQPAMMRRSPGFMSPMPRSLVMGYLPGASALNPYGAAYGGMPVMYGSANTPYGTAYPGTSSVSTYSTPYQDQSRDGAPAGPYSSGSASANRGRLRRRTGW
jgi:hypothetical protein